MSVCEPTLSGAIEPEGMVSDARPSEANTMLPRLADPSEKVTLPVGAGPPAVTVIDAVTVTGEPKTGDAGVTAVLTVAAAPLTVNCVVPLLAAVFASPE